MARRVSAMAGQHPVEAAIREGKFPESRRDHYMRLMAKNPKKTTKLIASLDPCLEPPDEMEAVGRYVDEPTHPVHAAHAKTGPTGYPQEWLDTAPVGGNIIAEPGANGQEVAVVAGPGEVL